MLYYMTEKYKQLLNVFKIKIGNINVYSRVTMNHINLYFSFKACPK